MAKIAYNPNKYGYNIDTERCDTCGVLVELDYYEGYGWLCSSCYEQYKQVKIIVKKLDEKKGSSD